MIVCRELTYYINPSSESIIELGTRAYPYKSINYAIFELFNLMSNKDVNFTIKLAKSDIHYLKHHTTALNNITKVTFEPYDASLKTDNDHEYGTFSYLNLDNLTRASIIIKSKGKPCKWPFRLQYFLSNHQILHSVKARAGHRVNSDSWLRSPVHNLSRWLRVLAHHSYRCYI